MNRIARIGGRFIYRGFRTVPDSEVRFYAPWNKALAGSWNESSVEVQGNKEEKRGEREGKRGIVFCSLDVDARLVPSFTLSRCIRTRFRDRKERERDKKRNFFVSARCLPRFMIAGSVTDEISMPMEARPIFHIEISLSLPTVGRVTYFPVLTSK